jgi:hypothetical protein
VFGFVGFDESFGAGAVLDGITGEDEFFGIVAEDGDHFVLIPIFGGFDESLNGFGGRRESLLVGGYRETWDREDEKERCGKYFCAHSRITVEKSFCAHWFISFGYCRCC